MPVSKVTISLPDGLLEELDRLAFAGSTTRSAVVKEAAVRYVAAQHSAETTSRRRAQTDRALEALAQLRTLPGRPGKSGTALLRAIRDTDDGGWKYPDE